VDHAKQKKHIVRESDWLLLLLIISVIIIKGMSVYKEETHRQQG
jgi:uncharacterized membrane-anchored protein